MSGRPNQKQRTRKDLLQAASRLLREGPTPTLEAVAAEALVSRATAYRYFPNLEALLAEAAADVATPQAEALFADGAPTDPVERVRLVDAALHEMVLANETPLRLMLAHSMGRIARGEDVGDIPARQNRRTPMIETALEPLAGEIPAETLERLTQALAVLIGTESMIVFKDVLQISADEALAVKRWAIGALVDAAKRDAQGPTSIEFECLQ